MKRIVASLMFALCAQQLMAQDVTITAGREAAARELVDIMNMERDMMSTTATMVDAMLLQSPQLDPYRDVILTWAESVMSWEVFGPKFVRMYAEAFTEEELRDLTAFYRTPTGQKALARFPELFSQGVELGAAEARSRQGELQQMIERRAAELRQSANSQ